MATSSMGEQGLKNRLFIMRHGESESNVQGILISVPEVGVSSYGLTKDGEMQAVEAAKLLESKLSDLSNETLAEKIIIISSDFKRTRETAQFVHDHFSVKAPLRLEPRLRERGCGLCENKDYHAFLETIFAPDRIDPTHTNGGCESLMNMVSRLTHVVQDVEKEFENKIVLLVSHGDPLLTLFTICSGKSPADRMLEDHFFNCEIREITSVV